VNARLNVNVALNRPSFQVSTVINSQNNSHDAKYANDGKLNTRLSLCMVTLRETYPWWAVDLGVALHVAGVKFTNREIGRMYSLSFVKTGLNENRF